MNSSVAFEFLWPLALLALPLPWLARRALPPAVRFDPALWLPVLAEYQAVGSNAGRSVPSWPAIVLMLVWAAMVVALMRPQLVEELPPLRQSGRDLMVALDTSESMRLTDFRLEGNVTNRLEAAKSVAGAFIGRREGDRVGLILFGTNAYLQAPLTLDRETVRILLAESSIGLAGGKTAIGDAIALAVLRLRELNAEQRVLVLMTDGTNTAGEVGPVVAARLAARNGLRIHTIGIGRPPSSERQAIAASSNTDALDEATLIAVAQATGGQYFLASDAEDLERIYAQIDQLEPVEREVDALFKREELYPWPLGVALVVLLLGDLLARRQQWWD